MTAPDPIELARCRALALEVPGVADAAVITRYAIATPPAPERSPARRAPGRRQQGVTTSGRVALTSGPPVQPGNGWAATLREALVRAAEKHADHGTTYVLADGTQDRQSYGRLLDDARRTLTGLRGIGLKPGDPVLFQFSGNRTFVTSFWACVLGGFLPTAVGLAPGYGSQNAVVRKLHAAWQLLERPPVLTDSALVTEVGELRDLWAEPGLRVLGAEDLATGPLADPTPTEPGDPVLNLLTSGSTGVPKCVQHRNHSLVARTWAAARANGFDSNEVTLNWMPLDHVGGMVMCNVRDVFLGCEHVNATTEAFVAKPLSWLDWTDRYRATNTWAPNFAFALVNDCADAIAAGSWDLSTLANICNAGEAVVSRTAHRFLELLRPHGLPDDAMRPCWGMSETSSGVTYSRLSAADPEVGTVTVASASLTGRLETVPAGSQDSVTFTEVGAPVAGVSLRIVGPADEPLPEGHVGRLQVQGATVMAGYHANPAANATAFTADGWFNTGDLAFLRGGRLTITGRENDLIIVNGQNHLSYEIESEVERVPGVLPTFVAACGVPDSELGTERLAVFFVPEATGGLEVRQVTDAVRGALARNVGLYADYVVALTADEFQKTGSGKIQRSAMVSDLLVGRFADRLAPPPAHVKASARVRPSESAEQGWFYQVIWRPAEESAPAVVPRGRYLLLGEGAAELAPALAAELPDGCVVATAVPGPEFAVLGPREYRFNPDRHGDYDDVVDAIRAGQGPELVGVVHVGALPALAAPVDSAAAAAGLRGAVIPVLWTIQALAEHAAGAPELMVVTSGAALAQAHDRVDFRKAALSGLVRTAAAESTIRSVRQLDLPASVSLKDTAHAIAEELARASAEPVVAARDGARLVPRLRPAGSLADLVPAGGLVPGGRYLVTGGLGGIGYELARHLLAVYGIRLLVVGRGAVDGDTDAGRRLNELARLGDVRHARVDVSDEAALEAAVATAEREWGAQLDGAFHLAGEPVEAHWDHLEQHTVLAESSEWMARMSRAKVVGGWVLTRLLERRPKAQLTLFSSVNGFFGGSSFAAYAVANSALDGLADHWAIGRGRSVRCLAWSMWTEVGMNSGSPVAAAESRGYLSIDVTQGLTSLLAALGQPLHHLVVGLDGGNPHIARVLDTETPRQVEVVVAIAVGNSGDGPATEAAVSAALRRDGLTASVLTVADLPRDTTGRVDERLLLRLLQRGGAEPFASPAAGLERDIADIWQQLLGVSSVGRDDSFFELGGNSLRAIQVVSRVNDLLGTRHPVRVLYEYPTVRGLAGALPS
ncbi:MAG TPA: SDR family NAD(P)-dependent oxidoreductase [Pseudonocardiaceae bacterium]